MELHTMLVVDACIRRDISRTRQLKDEFVAEFLKRTGPMWTVKETCLEALELAPMTFESLEKRERFCDRRQFSDSMFLPVFDLLGADLLVIAAPYWDLSFPASLKTWVEHMFVRNLTFFYQNDEPHGLVKARYCVYLTTSGSPIRENDWGRGYIKAAMGLLGISGFSSVSAEGLDLDGADASEILSAALVKTGRLAESIAHEFEWETEKNQSN